MKKVLLGIFAALLLSHSVFAADSFGRLTRTSATGLMFHVKYATEPVTYTPTTVVGPGIVMTKFITWATVAAATTFTVTVWDAFNGITGDARSRIVIGPTDILTAAGPNIMDFTSSKGSRKDDDGLYFKYYPTLVSAGPNSPTVQIMYQPWIQNKVTVAP